MRGESLLQESAKFVHSLVLLERGTTRSGQRAGSAGAVLYGLSVATVLGMGAGPACPWLPGNGEDVPPEVEDRASGRLPELVSPEVVAVPRLALSLGSFPEVES